VQSFIGETRVLEITDEELAETEIDGFDLNAQSIWCGNVADDYLVQVTSAVKPQPRSPRPLILACFVPRTRAMEARNAKRETPNPKP